MLKTTCFVPHIMLIIMCENNINYYYFHLLLVIIISNQTFEMCPFHHHTMVFKKLWKSLLFFKMGQPQSMHESFSPICCCETLVLSFSFKKIIILIIIFFSLIHECNFLHFTFKVWPTNIIYILFHNNKLN